MNEERITKFKDNALDQMIESAADKAVPIFKMFGWGYVTTKGNESASRDEIADTLRNLTRYALEDVAKGKRGWHSSGRFTVAAEVMEDSGLNVTFDLNLSEGYEDYAL